MINPDSLKQDLIRLQQETERDLARERKEHEYVDKLVPELILQYKNSETMICEAVYQSLDEDYYNREYIIEQYQNKRDGVPEEIQTIIDKYFQETAETVAIREADGIDFDYYGSDIIELRRVR